jgi:hypothetical protein
VRVSIASKITVRVDAIALRDDMGGDCVGVSFGAGPPVVVRIDGAQATITKNQGVQK